MKDAQARFKRYLERRYGDRSTPKHYMSDIGIFFEQLGENPPERIDMKVIDEFVERQMAQGLQASTVNRRLASLHTFFEYVASEAPDSEMPNPVNWRRHGVKESQKLPRDASDAEVRRLFAVMEDARDTALFGLMVGAGLRVGEIVALKMGDVEAPSAPDESARLRVMGKGRKERVVWITPKWYHSLQTWLSIREEKGEDFLFLNQHGRQLSVSGVQYRFKHYCQQAEVELTCHQLRHTFARRLAEQRMPTESIGHLLGHEQIATTQRYTAGAAPDLRQEFLTTMAQLDETPAPLPGPEWTQAPRPRPQIVAADPAALEQAEARLAPLPDWLRPTLCDYLRYRWRNWQPQRAAGHAYTISCHLSNSWQWLVSQRRLNDFSDLQRSDLEAWLHARQQAGIAASTCRSQLTLLLGSLRFACDQGHPIAANLFRIKPPALTKPLPRYLSEADYQQLLQTVQAQTAADTYRNRLERAWFLTLAHTGVRSCELLDLRLGDLDLAHQRLLVRGGKNAHERMVFLTPTLTIALSDYLQVRPDSVDDHLWIDKEHRPLSTGHLRARFRKWGTLAHISVSPHRLRHTLATQLINRNMPLTSVAKLLGHRSLDTTQHYAHLYEQTVKAHFHQAVAHIEGIAASHWPRSPADAVSNQILVEHSCDSV